MDDCAATATVVVTNTAAVDDDDDIFRVREQQITKYLYKRQ